MNALRSAPLLAFLVVTLAMGCSSEMGTQDTISPAIADSFTLETKADSVAARLMDAHGASAWASTRYVRFLFALETPTHAVGVARHFWDRTTGKYRLEWESDPDSSFVAIINVNNVSGQVPEGKAFLNGTKLSGAASEQARQNAYSRFVNDTYWLLAPFKVFDAGVNRSYAADSSNSEYDVLHLTFGDVGLTPGDEYWLYVSKETGRLARWSYRLQRMKDTAPPRAYKWTRYRTVELPAGPVTFATRKEEVGSKRAILTMGVGLPSSPPERVFRAPEHILAPDTNEAD